MLDTIPEIALEWHRAGRGATLATVVETWGSAPRPVGAQLVIDRDGAMEGSVSGGCVEGAVILEAIEALGDGQSRILEFGVSDDEAFAVGLACGGRIRVMVEPVGQGVPEDVLADLVAARAKRQAVAYAVDTRTWQRQVEPVGAAVSSGFEGDVFRAAYHPPLRMIIVGAVHIAQHLADMAEACGWDPILIDPRPVFGAEARFPGRQISDDWPDEALDSMGLDTRTAVVTLTHDPKLDNPAIEKVLRSNALYLGCLGSTRTHAKRVAHLESAGFTANEIARIHAPVGLNIGAQSPAEIAVSVMAEITQVLRG
ncbi:XdhC family protein [Shimia ponticola]|uniref:XdhC family protein n=1 Tax=Shimia ponticola TaxID=2582893 RepID=UPI002103024B|nr:XdhC family protein [Shimia ponticola]